MEDFNYKNRNRTFDNINNCFLNQLVLRYMRGDLSFLIHHNTTARKKQLCWTTRES